MLTGMSSGNNEENHKINYGHNNNGQIGKLMNGPVRIYEFEKNSH